MFYNMMLMTLFFSTLIVVSASSWFTAWVGFEFNTMVFLPLMYSLDRLSAEAMMKYFIIQTVGSIMLLSSGIFNSMIISTDMHYPSLSASFMIMALSIKLGMFPLYFWFPAIVEGLKWSSLALLLTWQKIAPLTLMVNFNQNKSMMTIIITMSALIGALGGLNQLFLRKLLAYSSITHMSWMTALTSLSLMTFTNYLLIYFILNLSILLIFYSGNFIHLTKMYQMQNQNPMLLLLFSLNFLSLGGMPPFLGFLAKWLAMISLLSYTQIFLASFLIMTSVITLFFYIRIAYQALSLPSSITLWPLLSYNLPNSSIMMMIPTLSLPMIMTFLM